MASLLRQGALVFLLVVGGVLGMVGVTVATASYDYDNPAQVARVAQNPSAAGMAPTPSARTIASATRSGHRASPEAARRFSGRCLATKGAGEFIGPVRQSSHEIANGHAFGKHVVERGEFPGVTTSDQFARRIEGVVSSPSASKGLSRGRSAYYDDPSNTLVIRDPRSPDGGMAFRPTGGRRYYDGLR